MGKVYAKAVVDLALQQVGKSCGKTNEYSAELDSVNFYNGTKNGAADSCSIFVDDMVFRCADPKEAKYVRSVMYEPDRDNCGASCKFAADYFKAHKAWIAKPSDFALGDKVFFQKSNGRLYHTGVVVGIGDSITTVEGNTNGGKVAKKTYSLNESKIAGAGRPNYTGFAPTEEPHQDQEPTPAPTPTPEPKPTKSVDEIAKEVIAGKWGNGEDRKKKLTDAGYDYKEVQKRVNELLGSSSSSAGSKAYTVKVNSFLRIRAGAGTKYAVVGKLHNGDKVNVYQQKNGFGKIDPNANKWVSMSYLV